MGAHGRRHPHHPHHRTETRMNDADEERQKVAELIYDRAWHLGITGFGGHFWELYDWAQEGYLTIADEVIARMGRQVAEQKTLIDNALALEHKPGAGKRDIIAALKGTDR